MTRKTDNIPPVSSRMAELEREVQKSAEMHEQMQRGCMHTTPFHQYVEAIRAQLHAEGIRPPADWWDSQKKRLAMYRDAGETVGLAVESMRMFAKGAIKAQAEEDMRQWIRSRIVDL